MSNKRKRDQQVEGIKSPVVKKIPITVLSGFLGAGKTTLTNHILSKCDNIAVIVNDMSVINIDASLIKRTSEQMIELSNGCICCTLRKDLLDTVQEICQNKPSSGSGKARKLPKAILIESTGIAEPIHVAETFAFCEEVENGKGLSNLVYIDAMVTVVDCGSFFHFLKQEPSGDPNNDEIYKKMLKDFVPCPQSDNQEGGVEGSSESLSVSGPDAVSASVEGSEGAVAAVADAPRDRTITDLFIDQIQFANIVLLNKVDLCSKDPVAGVKLVRDITAVVRHLNSYATLHQCSFGTVNPKLLLNTRLYEFAKMQERHEYFASEWCDSVPETEEYGIGSIVFKGRRPFHPERLSYLLFGPREEAGVSNVPVDTDVRTAMEAHRAFYKQCVIRSKGFIWLPTALGSERFVVLHATGDVNSCRLTRGRKWWCNVSEEERMQMQIQAAEEVHEEEEEDGSSEEEEEKSSGAEEGADAFAEVLANMDPVFGDRGQTLVVIGLHMDKQRIQEVLEDCLLTDNEMSQVVVTRAEGGKVTGVVFHYAPEIDMQCDVVLPVIQ